MPSIISHAVVGSACAWLSVVRVDRTPQSGSVVRIAMPLLAVSGILAMLPDADAIGFMLGVPYESLYGHRGITHSLLFGVLSGMVVGAFLHKRYAGRSDVHTNVYALWRCMTVCSIAACSHGILDGFTTGGHGVAYFAPWSELRYFFPYRVIRVSPIGVKEFYSQWGVRVLKSEGVWLLAPSLILILLVNLIRSVRRRKES